MKVEELDDFQQHITALTEQWEITLKGLSKGNEQVLTLSDEQAAKLEQEKLFLQNNLSEPPDVATITKAAQTINSEITQLIKILHDINNKEVLQASDIQEALYCIQLTHIRATQLATLAGHAKLMMDIGKQTIKSKALENAFFGMEEALFQGKPNPRVLDAQLEIFFSRTAPAVVKSLITKPVITVGNTETDNPALHSASQEQNKIVKYPAVTETPPETFPLTPMPDPSLLFPTLPKWLKEVMALSKSKDELRIRYQTYSTYANKDGIDDRLSNFIQKRLAPSKTRIEQLKLMEDTFKLLETSRYSIEQKIKIARGLMLVIKHQIEHEDNHFKSRMENMVEKYLNATDDSKETKRQFLAKDCINDFADFSTRLTTTAKMKKTIEKAKNDDTGWKETKTLFYQLHQKIDAIKEAISPASINTAKQSQKPPVIMYQGKALASFSEIHAALNHGIQREDISLNEEALTAQQAKALARERTYGKPYIYPSVNTLIVNSTKKIEELKDKLASLNASKVPKSFLHAHLQEIEAAMTDYTYLIKIADEQCKIAENRYRQSHNTKDITAVKETKKSLEALKGSLILLDEACTNTIKNPNIIRKNKGTPIIEATPKANRSSFPSNFIGLQRSKDSNNKKETAKTAVSNLLIEIMKIKDSIYQYPDASKFETAYNNDVQLISTHTERALNFAHGRYSAMRASSTENVSATTLIDKITMLTGHPTTSDKPQSIPQNITCLSMFLRIKNLDPQDKAKIYALVRTIEKQLTILAYLAEITELKLDPSVNVVRRVSDKQATALKDCFPQNLPQQLKEFQELRKIAFEEKLGIEPTRGSEPK